MQASYGLAGDTDATTAYLFECNDDGLFAVSCDRTGANIPIDLCAEGWRIKKKFALGVRKALPFLSDPEPILRSLQAKGYYIWRVGSNPKGTSQ
jgi:hypothetical protein